ncbi:MAG: PD-(D/E)XK nuclease family protein, partial [Verrucomicrobiota bacterium]|nr:PD-(D/E)XK nuclease family protein [Verrucomicrobiota bacterium]
RYGSWWHELMERIPWDKAADAWPQIFERHLADSPEPERSRTEWNLLLAHIGRAGNFRAILEGTEMIAHPEMPFFWSVDAATCLEGVIDLALFAPAAQRCLIIDWKTNRTTRGGTKELRERYRSQLAAYWKAVSAITEMPIAAGIFSTATGEFLAYTSEELEAEWSRLRTLHSAELAAAVVDPDAPQEWAAQASGPAEF